MRVFDWLFGRKREASPSVVSVKPPPGIIACYLVMAQGPTPTQHDIKMALRNPTIKPAVDLFGSLEQFGSFAAPVTFNSLNFNSIGVALSQILDRHPGKQLEAKLLFGASPPFAIAIVVENDVTLPWKVDCKMMWSAGVLHRIEVIKLSTSLPTESECQTALRLSLSCMPSAKTPAQEHIIKLLKESFSEDGKDFNPPCPLLAKQASGSDFQVAETIIADNPALSVWWHSATINDANKYVFVFLHDADAL